MKSLLDDQASTPDRPLLPLDPVWIRLDAPVMAFTRMRSAESPLLLGPLPSMTYHWPLASCPMIGLPRLLPSPTRSVVVEVLSHSNVMLLGSVTSSANMPLPPRPMVPISTERQLPPE